MNTETTTTVKAITTLAGTPFLYLVNLDTNVAHARRTCSGLGKGAAASSLIVKDANPGPSFTACGKCVPAKCLVQA